MLRHKSMPLLTFEENYETEGQNRMLTPSLFGGLRTALRRPSTYVKKESCCAAIYSCDGAMEMTVRALSENIRRPAIVEVAGRRRLLRRDEVARTKNVIRVC